MNSWSYMQTLETQHNNKYIQQNTANIKYYSLTNTCTWQRLVHQLILGLDVLVHQFGLFGNWWLLSHQLSLSIAEIDFLCMVILTLWLLYFHWFSFFYKAAQIAVSLGFAILWLWRTIKAWNFQIATTSITLRTDRNKGKSGKLFIATSNHLIRNTCCKV